MSPRAYAEERGLEVKTVLARLRRSGTLEGVTSERVNNVWVLTPLSSQVLTNGSVESTVNSESEEVVNTPKVGRTPLSFYDQVVEKEMGKLYLTDEFHVLNDGRKIQLRRRSHNPKEGWVEVEPIRPRFSGYVPAQGDVVPMFPVK